MGEREEKPRVRWSVSGLFDGESEPRRLARHCLLPAASRMEAIRVAATCFTEVDAIRIVRLTRKVKPKVVARLVQKITPTGTGGWIDSDGSMVERSAFLKRSFGKRVRLIFEELADS
jgi:hypothetical protein